MPQGTADPWLAVLAAGVMEGLGVPWPGAIIVAAAGLTAPGGWPTLLLLTVGFAIAYSVGSLGQYALGWAIGPRVLQWIPQGQRDQLERLMTRHGQAAVLLTRPLWIGNYISAPAGVIRMPLNRFLLATFIGIIPWALAFIWAGDALGAALGRFNAAIAQYLVPGSFATGAVMVAYALWKRQRRRSAKGRSLQ